MRSVIQSKVLVMKEQWKTIDGYSNKYQISNLGNVRKIGKLFNGFGKSGMKYYKDPIYLKPFDNGHGYKVVSLNNGKKVRKNHYIHRLVAEYFIDNHKNEKYVNHIDYDRSNNVVTNLEWCSALDNINHSLPNMIGRKKLSPTNTGHRYISKRSGKEEYRVSYMVNRKHKEKCFSKLEKALEFRNTIYGF